MGVCVWVCGCVGVWWCGGGGCGTHLTFCSLAWNFHQSRDSGGSRLTADSKEGWAGGGIGD